MTQPTKAIDEMEAAARESCENYGLSKDTGAEYLDGFEAGWQKCSEAQDKRIEGLVEAIKDVIRNSHDIVAKKVCSRALEEFGGKS